MRRSLFAALVVAMLAAACTSPEASRQRGQPGADPGNRPAIVDMHGQTDPAHDTPEIGKASELEHK